jgi:GntR family carbon starvation induced transcriptional regulator
MNAEINHHHIAFAPENSLAQQCYEQLQQEIIEGILKPGEKLKVVPLKKRFNIGQSPIREALSRLVAFDLVTFEENKGFRVAAISEADIRDTYATFTRIEKMALCLAIEKGDDSWEALIVSELHKLGILEHRTPAASYAIWAERNYNFHVALISGCNSPLLMKIRRTIYMKFDRYCNISYNLSKEELPRNHARHAELAAAVLARDTKKASSLLTSHINEPLEAVIETLKKNNLI